jgi:hypothetical protein
MPVAGTMTSLDSGLRRVRLMVSEGSTIPSFFVSHFNVVGRCAKQPVSASPGDRTTPLARVC